MSSLIITKNDTAVFETLQEFPCLSLGFLAELLGKKSVTYTHDNGKTETRYEGFRHRLKLLRKAGYIEVVNSVRPRVGQKNRHNVYALTAKARKLLPASKHGMRRSNNPHHDLGASFIAASFKLGVRADSRLRYLSPQNILEHQYCPAETRQAEHPFSIPVSYWHGKHVETHKKHDWRPFGIELGGRKILFAGIEYDRDQEGNESDDPTRSSIERHLRMILALLDDGYKAHFGTAKFFIPIVTTSQHRMNTMKRLLLDLTDGKGAERILFQVMPDWDVVQAFPKADGHMLTQQWHRVGKDKDGKPLAPLHLLDLIDTKKEAA